MGSLWHDVSDPVLLILLSTLFFFALAVADVTRYIPRLLAGIVIPLTGTLIPISVGVAVLQSGLFDVDILITRTLVYGALTASLVAVYFRAVTVGAGFSPAPTVAVVASTLAIAALFQPLRRHI